MSSQNLASTNYPIHDLLQRRWSPVAFADRAIAPETLCSLLEAANWSASCFNEQPWSYIVARAEDGEEFDRLLGCLVEANQEWAKHAPVLILSVAKLFFDHNGKDNDYAFHDVGAASTSLAIQATAMGLFVHQMAGFDAEKAREVYQIPEGYQPAAAIAIGYLGDVSTLSEKLQQRQNAPRSRKPLKDFVFSGTWQNTSPLVEG